MSLSPRPSSLFGQRAVALAAALAFASAGALAQSASPATPAVAPAGGSAPAATSPEYVLAPGDVLRITVYQNADLSIETRVSEAGTISYPLLNTVKLGGLSVQEAEKAIATGLLKGNFLKSPQVNISVAEVRGHQASVLGQVNKPGRYPIERAGLKLSELVALAGGVAATGSETVTLSGSRDGKPFRREVDLPTLFSAAGAAEDPVVLNGDTVFVDRAPTVYIHGEVLRAGQQRLERDMTVQQALAGGGGLTQRGTQRGMKVHRRDAAGQVKILDASPDMKLQANDIIYVKESLF